MSILILAEHDGQALKPATRRVVGAASSWTLPADVLVVGSQAVAREAAQLAGIRQVLHLECDAVPVAEELAPLLVELMHEHSVLLAAHSSLARDVLPRAAALLDVAMIGDAVRITGPASYVRPMYAGRLLAKVDSRDAIQVVTVRAPLFTPVGDAPAVPIQTLPALTGSATTRRIAANQQVSERPQLASARVVVSGGRALGEQFDTLLAPLAETLGAALGATRAAVDAGFAANELQVGQTGIVVAPGIYLAVGLSGAAQHLAGMSDSDVIVAINQDPDAPIFKVADYGLVGNLFETVPAVTRAIRQLQERQA
ncbi:MAG: electron transfer flavoprotein subunit alpha [Proteobacteria bacterium]|nr:electron transfer flavoprotein subunit alpha [Pseudomonadota bacterium]